MTGRINDRLQPIVSVGVVTAHGPLIVEAMLDSGFGGFLVLPTTTLDRSNAVFHSVSLALLADGSVVSLRKFMVRIEWLGTSRAVFALESKGGPLVGMSLMAGCTVSFDVRVGASVEVRPSRA